MKAGLTLTWSNGVTEGQTHRLKLLMRQGYGWAGFALIRQWAMQAAGAGIPRLLSRHTMSDTLAPLLVQATYICASAVIVEAYLGSLRAGTPPNIPSWGNIVAEGRSYVQLAFWIIFFPGLFVAITVLAINLVGDGLRDTLDPKLCRRM